MATTRVGISGWRYPPWRGTFSPADLPQRAELEFASSHVPVIEINGSFYSLQRPESYTSWYGETPQDFVFTIKAPRYITHIRRLKDVEAPVANFLASGLFNLKEKIGPILGQFPPTFKYDAERFKSFLKLLPHDTDEAADRAAQCDAWMKSRCQLKADASRPMRHAIEIRHASFLVPEFVDQLREHNVALVIAETARKWPMTQDITADFVYMRLHGDTEIYKSGYTDKSLDRWAERVRCWQEGTEPEDAEKVSPKKAPTSGPRDVYCFFDNTDVKLRAPFDAQSLMRRLGIPFQPVAPPDEAAMEAALKATAASEPGEEGGDAESAKPTKAVAKTVKKANAPAAALPRKAKASANTKAPARAKAPTKTRAPAKARPAAPKGTSAKAAAKQTNPAAKHPKTGTSASSRRGVTGSRR